MVTLPHPSYCHRVTVHGYRATSNHIRIHPLLKIWEAPTSSQFSENEDLGALKEAASAMKRRQPPATTEYGVTIAGGAWQATVLGAAKARTQLSD